MKDKPLIHWGIPGMKWGIRKQYTFASKKHRSAAENNAKVLAKMSGRKLKKDPSKMTDTELHKKLTFLTKYYNKAAPSEVAMRLGTVLIASYAITKVPDILQAVAWTTGKIVSSNPVK